MTAEELDWPGMARRMTEANLTQREHHLMFHIGHEQAVNEAPTRRRLVELTGWDRRDVVATVRSLKRRGLVTAMPHRNAPVCWASEPVATPTPSRPSRK